MIDIVMFEVTNVFPIQQHEDIIKKKKSTSHNTESVQ